MLKKLFPKTKIREYLVINFGVFLAALSFSFFLDQYDIVIGGVGGIGIIINHLIPYNVPTSFIVLILNIILLIASFVFLGKDFFIKTIFGSVMFPVYSFLIALVMQKLPVESLLILENNYFLIIIISAILMGYGIGYAMKYGASTGGVDILQYMMLKYFKMPLTASIIIIDGIVIVYGAVIFQSFATLLYGIVYMVVSGYVIDSIILGGFHVRAVHIITSKSDEIKAKIYQVLGRGVTEVYTRGGYSGIDSKMIICVLTTREYYILRTMVQKIDEKAFIYVTKASEVRGEGFTYDAEEEG